MKVKTENHFEPSIQSGLGKSRSMFERITRLFKQSSKIDEDLLEKVEELLIESDVGVELSLNFVESLRETRIDSEDPVQEVRNRLKELFLEIFQETPSEKSIEFEKPHVVLVIGVNGTGKTTTIGKLANQYKKNGKKVLLAGADTFRAAASEQLSIWAERTDSEIVVQAQGADPASVAYDALDAAISRNVDILFVDTAGRLHNKVNLMEELKKIKRVLQKRMDSSPHEILLVMDAVTGQNGLSQAKRFKEAVGVTSIALTKLDGTAKGGIVVSIVKESGIPVRWVGVGEGVDDLIPFDPEAYVEGLLCE